MLDSSHYGTLLLLIPFRELRSLRLFEFFKNSESGLLFFCADRHEVNISLSKLAVKKRPKHVMVACDRGFGLAPKGMRIVRFHLSSDCRLRLRQCFVVDIVIFSINSF